jgi:hypothetical protein
MLAPGTPVGQTIDASSLQGCSHDLQVPRFCMHFHSSQLFYILHSLSASRLFAHRGIAGGRDELAQRLNSVTRVVSDPVLHAAHVPFLLGPLHLTSQLRPYVLGSSPPDVTRGYLTIVFRRYKDTSTTTPTSPDSSLRMIISKILLLAPLAILPGVIANILPRQSNATLDSCPGYKASGVETSDSGLTASLTLAGTACNVFGADLEELTLIVEYQSSKSRLFDHRMHLPSTNTSYRPAFARQDPRPRKRGLPSSRVRLREALGRRKQQRCLRARVQVPRGPFQLLGGQAFERRSPLRHVRGTDRLRGSVREAPHEPARQPEPVRLGRAL